MVLLLIELTISAGEGPALDTLDMKIGGAVREETQHNGVFALETRIRQRRPKAGHCLL